jgi:hypothetical protein
MLLNTDCNQRFEGLYSLIIKDKGINNLVGVKIVG